MSADRLVPGVYDTVVNVGLAARLEAVATDQRTFDAPLHNDRELAALAFARVLHDRALATLRGLPDREGVTAVEQQVELTNALLSVLENHGKATLPSDHATLAGVIA